MKGTESEQEFGEEQDVSKSTFTECVELSKVKETEGVFTEAAVVTWEKDVLVHETEISVASMPVQELK